MPAAAFPGVLLDTNAYRELAMDEARFQRFLEAERRRGVARYADPFAVSELLAHLANPQDRDFALCRRAVVRVWQRCGPSGGEPCGIIRDSESRFAEVVTGAGLAGHDARTETIGVLIGRVAAAPLDQPLDEEENSRLRVIAAHVAEQKARFVETGRRLQATIEAIHAGDGHEKRKETMKRARRTHASPATRRGFAEGYIRGAFTNAGVAPPDPLPDALVDRVYPYIATAVEFEALIWEKLAFDGAKPESRGIQSLRWDQRIAFNIGQSIGVRPLWLVTGDGDFARAAKAAGHGDRVLTLDQYERWLGIGS
ncbi:MAG TPA: hypothetical protein VJQ53_09465 [Candidatus Eisenbacteria bacterium]|nr:hypothetical protein [Candidatus Eisenbacteria bacterium]